MEWQEQALAWENIPGEDGLHTPDFPYCGNMECWCHTSVAYHSLVEYSTYAEEEVEQAYLFFELPQ